MQNLLKKTSSQPESPPSAPSTPASNPVKLSELHHSKSRRVKTLHSHSLPHSDAPPLRLWHKYLLYLPYGLLGIVGWAVLGFLFWRVEPSFIKNLFLPNSYIVLLTLVFLANCFLLGYLLMNTRRGILFGATITLVLFLKLQRIFSFPFLSIFFLLPIFLELFLTQLKRDR